MEHLGFENAVSIWRFADAPDEFRKLSRHGGDEDILVFVPGRLTKLSEYQNLLDGINNIHFAEPSSSWHEDGLVLIFAHA